MTGQNEEVSLDFIPRSCPFIGFEFYAPTLQSQHARQAATLFIEPGAPWESGYCESLNSKMRDTFLSEEIFSSLKEVQALAECRRACCNTERPHSSLGYRPPAPAAGQAECSQGYSAGHFHECRA
jgi:transposase InsO family protein